MRRVALFVVTCGLLTGFAAADDAKYEVKAKKNFQGQRVAVTKTAAVDTTVNLSVMGQDKEVKEKMTELQKYTETILERTGTGRHSEKERREYEAAERTKNGKRNIQPQAGKNVVITKSADGSFKFNIDGEDVPGEDVEELDKEFNKKDKTEVSDEDFLPGKPVKLNEPWAVDAVKLAKSFGEDSPFEADPDKSKATGRLTKAYRKDGKQFGVIELKVDLVPVAFKLGGDKVEMKKGSVVTVTVTIDACIDGTSHNGVSNTVMKMSLEAELPNGEMKIVADAKMQETHEELAK